MFNHSASCFTFNQRNAYDTESVEVEHGNALVPLYPCICQLRAHMHTSYTADPIPFVSFRILFQLHTFSDHCSQRLLSFLIFQCLLTNTRVYNGFDTRDLHSCLYSLICCNIWVTLTWRALPRFSHNLQSERLRDLISVGHTLALEIDWFHAGKNDPPALI